MIKKLTELFGVSGCEDEVRDFIKSEIAPLCEEIKTDSIGNLYALKKGKSSEKTFMLCAHMDEVGFIVKDITDDGYIKFASVGGIDSRILLGKRVMVGEKKLSGVIGIKAVHLTTKKEREKVVEEKDMYIDIGVDTLEDAQKYVSKGDYIMFDSEYTQFGDGKIKAKAIDDRAGCAVIIDLIKNADFYYDTWCVFTVQEEVGTRGAQIAARKIKPDIALILESTICGDVHGVDKNAHVSTMGGGAVLSVMERTSRSDPEFIKFIEQTAKENNLPVQFKRTGNGGNDAGAVQIAGSGVRTAVMSLPCRYIHSPVSMMDKNDFETVKKLAKAVSENIGNRF